LHREAFRHRCVYTEKPYTQNGFTHGNLLHREAFADRSFFKEELFAQSPFYAQNDQLHFPNTPKNILRSFVWYRRQGASTEGPAAAQLAGELEALGKKEFKPGEPFSI
jgi:hypothetical protein